MMPSAITASPYMNHPALADGPIEEQPSYLGCPSVPSPVV
jgi:hypothetical protein